MNWPKAFGVAVIVVTPVSQFFGAVLLVTGYVVERLRGGDTE